MDKGKEKVSFPSSQQGYRPSSSRRTQTYLSAFQKSEEQLKKEALKAIPKEDQLREDAYQLAVKSASQKEYVYPYIPIATIWIAPIERKYYHLSAEEVITFYLKNNTDPFLYPKDSSFYQEILTLTGSIHFDSTIRAGGDWAFSKATILKVITPEKWEGDLYKFKEFVPDTPYPSKNKFMFNYFDYVKAWDIAFCYENRQKKHSWFFQFKGSDFSNLPNWFLIWFSNWGLYPLILPNKIRKIYEDFMKTNPSLKTPAIIFAILYQVPWIARWDTVVIKRNFKRLDMMDIPDIPFLGRRILIKWWDKFEFFKDSVFSVKGIINLEPVKPVVIEQQKKDAVELLKELLAGTSKGDLKKQIRNLLDSSSEEDDASDDEDLMSQGTDRTPDPMQDSQDPFP